jgi:receptor protein-tyrosine kinase
MTIGHVLGLLRRRLLPLVLCVVAGVGGGLAHGQTSQKVYQSSARLFMDIPAAQTTQEALQGVQLSGQLLQSYADIVTSRTSVAQVRERLGLSTSVESLQKKLSASTSTDALILTITGKDANPQRAQQLAETAAAVFNETIQGLETNRSPSSAVQARVIDNAVVPASPVSPGPLRDGILGLVLGLLGGLILAFALDALDRSLKKPAEVEAIVGAPDLGSVPRFRKGRGPVLAGERGGAAAEAYRSIRTAVRFLDPDSPPRALVVTSPRAGEGKSTTAINLALALAHSGHRVAIVDADLREPALAKQLKLKARVGLTDVLTGDATLETAMHTYRPTLEVLFAGQVPPNPSEMLGSQKMLSVIDELVEKFDYVIFDAPPVLPVTDAVVLATQVDGVVMVVRQGRTSRAAAGDAARRLNAVNANLVGFVLNDRPRPESDAYYHAYDATERAKRPVLEV